MNVNCLPDCLSCLCRIDQTAEANQASLINPAHKNQANKEKFLTALFCWVV